MVPTIGSSLLAATMLLGQTSDVQIIQQPGTGNVPPSMQTQPAQPTSRPFFSWFSSGEHPVLTRIQGWFGRKDQQEPPLQPQYRQPTRVTPIEATPTSNPAILPASPAPGDFPRKMPSDAGPGKGLSLEPAPSAVKVQQTGLNVPNTRSPIRPQLADHIARDEKFEWITGQLEIENGLFVIYYASPETVDKYHGRIVLQPEGVDMRSFHRGDLISVRGNLIQRQTPQGEMPVYRLSFASSVKTN